MPTAQQNADALLATWLAKANTRRVAAGLQPLTVGSVLENKGASLEAALPAGVSLIHPQTAQPCPTCAVRLFWHADKGWLQLNGTLHVHQPRDTDWP